MIGRGSHIVAHYSIEIGDDIFTGPYVYITDQNHQYEDIATPIGRSEWPVNSAVRIGAGSWLGTGAVILPGASIRAERAVVASGSVVRGTVPDNCVVAGVLWPGWSASTRRAWAGAAPPPRCFGAARHRGAARRCAGRSGAGRALASLSLSRYRREPGPVPAGAGCGDPARPPPSWGTNFSPFSA